jgi:predicted alpha/beta hydrolase
MAFVLADAGYDVWLGNTRCVQKKHCYLDPSESEFWDWSLDELAKYDFPGMLSTVLKHTGHTQAFVLGHSQGVAQVR